MAQKGLDEYLLGFANELCANFYAAAFPAANIAQLEMTRIGSSAMCMYVNCGMGSECKH